MTPERIAEIRARAEAARLRPVGQTAGQTVELAKDVEAALDYVAELEAQNAQLREALEAIRSGLRNLPASATAVQLDEIAAAALAPAGKEKDDAS